MNGNFKRGDVVVQIGGSSAYVVSRRHGIWYEVKYLWCDKVCESDVHYFSLDPLYVKVDFCKNTSDVNVVRDKLMRIARAFRGGLKPMKCDFGKGDVIVNIDGNNVYIVSDAHTNRYSLLARLRGEVVHLVFDKDVIDEKYVKVDKCNPKDFAEVIDKLGDIWYNLLKGEN